MERETETVRWGDRQGQRQSDISEGLSPVRKQEKGGGMGRTRRDWEERQHPSTLGRVDHGQGAAASRAQARAKLEVEPGSGGGVLGGCWAEAGAPGVSPGPEPRQSGRRALLLASFCSPMPQFPHLYMGSSSAFLDTQ